MSDIDDELLALAGDISKAPSSSNKRPRKSTSNGKRTKLRKKVDMDSESDMEMSSGSEAAIPTDGRPLEDTDEEEDSRASNTKPFSYEGIYVDAADKMRIQALSELEREAILGERQDQLQKIRDRENIKNMVRARDEESIKRSSGREKNRTGTTTEKAQKLDELKMKRQAKGKRPKSDEKGSNENRNKRAEDMDWDVSEDGEIDAVDEQAPLRENRPAPPRLDDDASLDDIRSVMLTRKRAAELCCAQFFPEYVKGTWVRVSVGFAKDDPKREIKYRVAEVRGVTQHKKYYEVENQATKVALVVVIAKSEKTVLLDIISNSPIQENEWLFVVGECQKHEVKVPTKKEITRKQKYLEKYRDWVKDETHITMQVRAKKDMRAQNQGQAPLSIADRLRLQSERDQAAAVGDTELHARLSAQLENVTVTVSKTDMLSEVNERNRRANRDEVRRAELAAADTRRKQMKALEAGRAVKLDPSARVRINPKLTYETKSGSSSRAMTPLSEASGSARPAGVDPSAPSAVAAAKAKGLPTRFEEMIASQVQVDIDIGDF